MTSLNDCSALGRRHLQHAPGIHLSRRDHIDSTPSPGATSRNLLPAAAFVHACQAGMDARLAPPNTFGPCGMSHIHTDMIAEYVIKMGDQHGDWARWLREAQGGDRRSYEALLSAALPWLRRMARRRFTWADAAEAEDIVQDTLLALHCNLHLYDPARPAAPFLLGILKLRGADRRRSRARHQVREAPLDDLPVTSMALATKETQEVSIDVERVSSAVGALPPRDREILEMLKLREMSLAETSAATGMSVGALKVATFRAIRRLRAKLGVTDEE